LEQAKEQTKTPARYQNGHLRIEERYDRLSKIAKI